MPGNREPRPKAPGEEENPKFSFAPLVGALTKTLGRISVALTNLLTFLALSLAAAPQARGKRRRAFAHIVAILIIIIIILVILIILTI